MQRFASINEKVAPVQTRTMSSHPASMPVRSVSGSSALSDNEAVPVGDPVNVRLFTATGRTAIDHILRLPNYLQNDYKHGSTWSDIWRSILAQRKRHKRLMSRSMREF